MNVLMMRSSLLAAFSNDEASWFETAQERLLILRSGTSAGT